MVMNDFVTDVANRDNIFGNDQGRILVAAMAKQAGMSTLTNDAKLASKRTKVDHFGWCPHVVVWDVLEKDKRIRKPLRKLGFPRFSHKRPHLLFTEYRPH